MSQVVTQSSTPKYRFLSIFLLVLLGIYVAVKASTYFALTLLVAITSFDNPNVQPASGEVLISVLKAIYPYLAVIAVFGIGIYMHRRQKYLLAITLAAIPLIAVVGLTINNMWQIKQDGPRSTFPSGFLVPTPQSIPPNFVVSDRTLYGGYVNMVDGHPLYYGKTYTVDYSAPSINSFVKLEISEDRLGMNYQDSLDPNKSGLLQFEQKIKDFTFGGLPGVLYSENSRPGLVSYDLVWDDQGYPLIISLVNVPPSKFAPDSVINMLQTFIRSK